jgi:hypothetical protein
LCKNKICSEFCDLQLCQKEQSQNSNRFWDIDLKLIFKSKLYFFRLFLKAKFEKTLNTNLAPNCILIISKWLKWANKVQHGKTSIYITLNLLKQHIATCMCSLTCFESIFHMMLINARLFLCTWFVNANARLTLGCYTGHEDRLRQARLHRRPVWGPTPAGARANRTGGGVVAPDLSFCHWTGGGYRWRTTCHRPSSNPPWSASRQTWPRAQAQRHPLPSNPTLFLCKIGDPVPTTNTTPIQIILDTREHLRTRRQLVW